MIAWVVCMKNLHRPSRCACTVAKVGTPYLVTRLIAIAVRRLPLRKVYTPKGHVVVNGGHNEVVRVAVTAPVGTKEFPQAHAIRFGERRRLRQALQGWTGLRDIRCHDGREVPRVNACRHDREPVPDTLSETRVAHKHLLSSGQCAQGKNGAEDVGVSGGHGDAVVWDEE